MLLQIDTYIQYINESFTTQQDIPLIGDGFLAVL